LVVGFTAAFAGFAAGFFGIQNAGSLSRTAWET
jgi:hypothetical protein